MRPRIRPPTLGSLRPNASSIRPLSNIRAIRVVATAEVAPPQRIAIPRAAIAGGLVVGLAICAYAGLMPHTSDAPRTLTPVVVSGTAGLKTTPAGTHERWGNRPLTVTFDASLDEIDPAAKDAVKTAFGEWAASDSALPPISFDSSKASGKAAQDGKNLVLYGPITIKGHEHDVAVTIGYVDAQTGEILEADTIFNSAYAFGVLDAPSKKAGEGASGGEPTRPCEAKYDLQNVATHEAGHLFGLGEDVEDAHATMYLRSNPCETHKRAITEADRAVMASLYAEAAPGASAAGAAYSKGCGR